MDTWRNAKPPQRLSWRNGRPVWKPMTRKQYYQQLLDALMREVATLTAKVRGNGVDSRGNPIAGLDARLEGLPDRLQIIAKYARECEPK